MIYYNDDDLLKVLEVVRCGNTGPALITQPSGRPTSSSARLWDDANAVINITLNECT